MSKEIKHTPGPWNYEVINVHFKVIRGKNNNHIADVTKNWLLTDSFVESFANARLIATAPELLEACETALGMINHVGCIQRCSQGVIQISEEEIEQCQWCCEKNRIEQAIAKAGGKT